MGTEIDTLAKRARLPDRKNPFWVGISGGRGGVSLGYRRGSKGHGSWIAKVVIDGQRVEERLSCADDAGAPSAAMGYRAAVAATLEWSARQHDLFEGRKESGTPKSGPTVRTAVETYATARRKRSASGGANADGRLKRHVLADEQFAAMPLSKVRATAIEGWRSRLDPKLTPSTVNRLLNDLRAALNASAERHRRELSPHLPGEIRVGTRAVSVATVARRQLLTDAEVRRIVEAASTVDPEGDFGRLVTLAAATGARYSQLAALTVGHLQPARGRVMVPGSSKGRAARARPPAAVPLTADVIVRLTPAVEGRKSDAPLLTRWGYRRAGGLKWERDAKRALGPAYEVEKLWAATIERAGAPVGTTMYALRHSSIVRGLRAGLPVRLVAALHDTSTEMIEAHYSAHILDATEDLARRVAVSFAPEPIMVAAE